MFYDWRDEVAYARELQDELDGIEDVIGLMVESHRPHDGGLNPYEREELEELERLKKRRGELITILFRLGYLE